MNTANEMKKRADGANLAKHAEEINLALMEIEAAAATGEYSITLNRALTKYTIAHLQALGFTINPVGNTQTEVSWKNVYAVDAGTYHINWDEAIRPIPMLGGGINPYHTFPLKMDKNANYI